MVNMAIKFKPKSGKIIQLALEQRGVRSANPLHSLKSEYNLGWPSTHVDSQPLVFENTTRI